MALLQSIIRIVPRGTDLVAITRKIALVSRAQEFIAALTAPEVIRRVSLFTTSINAGEFEEVATLLANSCASLVS